MHMLQTTAEPVELMRAGFELGRYVEEVNKHLAVWAALKQKEAEYARRKSGADAIHGDNRSIREEAIAYYMQHRERLKGNVSAAAREIERQVPMKNSTIRRWITEQEASLDQ